MLKRVFNRNKTKMNIFTAGSIYFFWEVDPHIKIKFHFTYRFDSCCEDPHIKAETKMLEQIKMEKENPFLFRTSRAASSLFTKSVFGIMRSYFGSSNKVAEQPVEHLECAWKNTLPFVGKVQRFFLFSCLVYECSTSKSRSRSSWTLVSKRSIRNY